MRRFLASLFIVIMLAGITVSAKESDVIRAKDIPEDLINFVNENVGEAFKVESVMNNQDSNNSEVTWGGGYHAYSISHGYDDMMSLSEDDFFKLANFDQGWLFYIYKDGKPGSLFTVNYVKGKYMITNIGGDSSQYIEAMNAMIKAHGENRKYVVAASGNYIVDVTEKQQTFLLTSGSEYDKDVYPVSELVTYYKKMHKENKEEKDRQDQEYRKTHGLPDNAKVPQIIGNSGSLDLADFVPSNPNASESSQMYRNVMLIIFSVLVLFLGVIIANVIHKRNRRTKLH